jgi:quercetin dioxygenase-like cupin family protein
MMRRTIFAALLAVAMATTLSHRLIGQDQAAGRGGAGGGGRGQQTPEQAALQAARVGNSTTMDLEGSNLGRRHFAAGNRTYWHTHEGGFLMLVEKGKGRVQHRGQAMKELAAGEVDYTPPGVEHWHGAAPNDEMVQLAVVVGGGGIMFKDPVSDAEYNGK